jgi:hypothetical protein
MKVSVCIIMRRMSFGRATASAKSIVIEPMTYHVWASHSHLPVHIEWFG